MPLPTWRPWLHPQGRRARRPRPPQRQAPRLEVLEDRCLLSLGAPTLYTVTPNPVAMVAGHFAGFGDQDLVTVGNQVAVNQGPNQIPAAAVFTVLVNNGHGVFNDPSFPSVTTTVSGVTVSQIAVGDFNGDGKMDVAALGMNAQGASEVYVLFGNGDGTFNTGNIGPYAAGTNPDAIIAAPLGGPTQEDLIVHDAGGPNAVSVLVNNGNGTFNAPVGYGPAGAAGAIAVGDFAGDDNLDVAVSTGSTLDILTGDGTGVLSSQPIVSALSISPSVLAAGSFTGGAKTDLAAGDSDGHVVILQNDGAGDFTAVGSPVTTDLTTLDSMTTGDFTDDGKLDIAVAGPGGRTGGEVEVFAGDGQGGLGQTPDSSSSFGTGSISLTAAGLNNDGVTDLAAADAGSPISFSPPNDDVAVFLAQQVDHFALNGVPSSVTAGQPFAFTLIAEDVNNNPVAGYAGTVHFTASDGDNSGLPADYTFTAADKGAHTFSATLNARGTGISINATDTVTTRIVGTSRGITVNAAATGSLPPAGPAVTVGKNGQFFGSGAVPIVTSVANGSVSVVASQPTDRGKGGGTAQPGRSIASTKTGIDPTAEAAGSLFGDRGNTPFLAVANAGSNSVSILTPATGSKSADNLANRQTINNVGNQPRALAVGDFQRKGVDDLAVANIGNGGADTGSVALLLQTIGTNGNPQLTPGPVLTNGVNKPDAVAAGDFNGDDNGKKDDLAVANTGDGTVSIFLNNGSGQLVLAHQIAVGPNPTAIVAGDFNGDGHLDLAVATAGDNSVRILYGNGAGNFTIGATIAVGSQPDALAVADVATHGGNGPPDLIVGNFGDGTATVILQPGGAGQSVQTYQLPANAHPTSVAAGDFNGDGFTDVVTANADGTQSYLLNQGHGDGALAPESKTP